MKIPWYWLLGIALFVLTAVVLTAAQTTLWFLVFGSFPGPMFWLVILVYVSVTRPLWEATLIAYLIAMSIAPFTASPFEGILIYSLALMGMIIVIRERVFWGGPSFFMLMVGVATVAAPFFYWIISRWFDKNPLFFPNVFDWLISACLTTVASLPLYALFQIIDRIADRGDIGSESRVGPR